MSQVFKSSCPMIEMDDDAPYPTDEWLERLRTWHPESVIDAMLFFVYDLPEILETHLSPYGYCKVTEDKDGRFHVYTATGGWSGCEDVMRAIDRSSMKDLGMWRWMWWEMSQRGGACTWVIPGIKP